eukprot:7547803-Pyramimonas_sp.AAC.1
MVMGAQSSSIAASRDCSKRCRMACVLQLLFHFLLHTAPFASMCSTMSEAVTPWLRTSLSHLGLSFVLRCNLPLPAAS